MDPVEKGRKLRSDAQWFFVVGFGMIFASGINTAFILGSVVMVSLAVVRYGQSIPLLRKAEDPWEDPEINAWEARQIHGEPHDEEE